jgi:hypothetical protein
MHKLNDQIHQIDQVEVPHLYQEHHQDRLKDQHYQELEDQSYLDLNDQVAHLLKMDQTDNKVQHHQEIHQEQQELQDQFQMFHLVQIHNKMAAQQLQEHLQIHL